MARPLLVVVPFTREDLETTWDGEWPLLTELRQLDFWRDADCDLAPLVLDPRRPRGVLAAATDFLALAGRLRRDSLVVVWYGGRQMIAMAVLLAVVRRFGGRQALALIGVEWPRPHRLSKAARMVRRFVLRQCELALCNTTGQARIIRDGWAPESEGKVRYLRYAGPKGLPARSTAAVSTRDAGFSVFSGGANNRDLPTLVEAVRRTGVRATVVAPDVPAGLDTTGIEMTGRVPFTTFDELLTRSSVVVITLADPDVSSGHLVLLHALQRAKPMVLTAFSGVEDYVTDGVDALVVPHGDAAALAEAVVRLRDDAGLRARLAAGAAKTLQDVYGWAVYARYLAEHLSELRERSAGADRDDG